MRPQNKLIFQIGYNPDHDIYSELLFQHDIIWNASAIAGGCTTSVKTGHWLDVRQDDGTFGDAPLQKETCFEVELTVEEAHTEAAYEKMQQIICNAVARVDADINWVHVSQTAIIGRHFSVKELNK